MTINRPNKTNSNGFSLVEMLVIIGVIGIIASTTVAVFTRFNRQQNLGIAHKAIKNDLAQAKSYALSQVVRNCTAGVLIGYEMYRVTTSTYNIREVCQPALASGNDRIWPVDKPLPSNVTFSNSFNIRFVVLSGGSPTGGSITLTSDGRSLPAIIVTNPEGVIQ